VSKFKNNLHFTCTLPYVILYKISTFFRIMRSSKHFQKSMWALSKYAINSLLHFIDIFSVTGLEFVNKILSYSCKSIETHGKGNKLIF